MISIKIFTITLGATVLGVALGVLFAPNKSFQTRPKILMTSQDFTDQFTDGFGEKINHRSGSADRVQMKPTSLLKKGKARAKKAVAMIYSKMH